MALSALALTDVENQTVLAPWQETPHISGMQVFGAYATAGAVSASMPAVSGQINYVYQAQVSCTGSTTAAEFTLTGLTGATIYFEVVQNQPMTLPMMGHPASGTNTAVTLSGTAPAATRCAATLEGFVL
jgi:hypothetical protein